MVNLPGWWLVPPPMPVIVCCLLALFTMPLAAAAGHSALWGEAGEAWTADSRLPDFSFAGYRMGDAAIPELPVTTNVRDHGAVGDGEADDTAAFMAAIDATAAGAILIPAGRYVIRDPLVIQRSGVVLRGEGEASVLFFPRPLNDWKARPTSASHGAKTTQYSWSGGFVGIRGKLALPNLTTISAAVARGSVDLPVASTEGLEVGQDVVLRVRDDEDGTMMAYLYGGDPGDVGDARRHTFLHRCRIIAIGDGAVRIDRALRQDLRPEWSPELCAIEPSVSGSGIEALTLEFPVTPYGGHFSELGYNGVVLGGVIDCWVRDLRIRNPDSGIFCHAHHCTLSGITITSQREPSGGGRGRGTGHHGITLGGGDNLLDGFALETRFVHDITVSGTVGNVAKGGRAEDLACDHHKWTPWANLFTDIDAGVGSRLFHSGGGKGRARHCAGWATWWGITAEQPLAPPERWWWHGPLNLVGLTTERATSADDALWFEAIEPAQLEPRDLHRAQLDARLGGEAPE